MFTKTKIALAAALIAATSSVALAAQHHRNHANEFQSAPSSLSDRNAGQDPVSVDLNDRASSPYAGGVN
jgi:hypothetical protein